MFKTFRCSGYAQIQNYGQRCALMPLLTWKRLAQRVTEIVYSGQSPFSSRKMTSNIKIFDTKQFNLSAEIGRICLKAQSKRRFRKCRWEEFSQHYPFKTMGKHSKQCRNIASKNSAWRNRLTFGVTLCERVQKEKPHTVTATL